MSRSAFPKRVGHRALLGSRLPLHTRVLGTSVWKKLLCGFNHLPLHLHAKQREQKISQTSEPVGILLKKCISFYFLEREVGRGAGRHQSVASHIHPDWESN